MASSICVLTIRTRRRRKIEFVESIKEDVEWLGADWEDQPVFCFRIILIRCMSAAVKLIQKGQGICLRSDGR